jgi:hypothetical protein
MLSRPVYERPHRLVSARRQSEVAIFVCDLSLVDREVFRFPPAHLVRREYRYYTIRALGAKLLRRLLSITNVGQRLATFR